MDKLKNQFWEDQQRKHLIYRNSINYNPTSYIAPLHINSNFCNRFNDPLFPNPGQPGPLGPLGKPTGRW